MMTGRHKIMETFEYETNNQRQRMINAVNKLDLDFVCEEPDCPFGGAMIVDLELQSEFNAIIKARIGD